MDLRFNFDEEILNSRGRMIIRDFFGTDVKKKKKWPKYDTFSLLTNLKRAVAGLHILISPLSVTRSLWQALGGLCRGQLIKRIRVKKSNMNYYVENTSIRHSFSGLRHPAVSARTLMRCGTF